MWPLTVQATAGPSEKTKADPRPGGAARTEAGAAGLSLSAGTDAVVGHTARPSLAGALTRHSSCGLRLCKRHCPVHSGESLLRHLFFLMRLAG